MSSTFVAVPVKPFGVAKARLAPVLGSRARSRLGRAVLAHTIQAASAAGGMVAVVTADPGVARWAKAEGVEVVPEDPQLGTGLDGAARSGVAAAGRLGLPWAVVHGDLPLAEPADLREVFEALRQGPVIVPSLERGTNVVAASLDDFPFSYGPDSFGRHLAAAARLGGAPPRVLVRAPLGLDLDGPRELQAIHSHPQGAWIESFLGSSDR
ncbi:MAG: 2-phospho-L-lactate guanylyltransferase [Acidimicrobiia bacterium]